jgi:hypothetical protein
MTDSLPVRTRNAYVLNGLRFPAGTDAVLRPASRSGMWQLACLPAKRGPQTLDVMPAYRAAREYPEHATVINGRPDSTD